MTSKADSADQWLPCEPGALSGFVGRERKRHTRRRFLYATAHSLAAVLVAGTVIWFEERDKDVGDAPLHGSISCHTVRQYLAANASPSGEIAHLIRQHLQQCQNCQDFKMHMQVQQT